MLRLYETLPGTNIMSLRIGGPVAQLISPIINPNNLYIEGWYVNDNRSNERYILLSQDIRDVLPQGFVIDDIEVFAQPDELVRLKEVIDLKFELLKLRVSSISGRNYGKVSDFALETQNFYVQKLYVAQSIVKNFGGGTLSIDRSQIIEITNRRVIIDDPTEKAKVQVVATAASQS
jgi:sporulation protein YlmC with PRC-barrel domain